MTPSQGALMFSHVAVGADDLEAAGRFYDAVLAPLGLRQRAVAPDGGPPALCWIDPARPLPRFYVYRPFNRQPATPGNGSMVAFLAPSPEAVDAAYAAGIAAGGTEQGVHDLRHRNDIGYYRAYMRVRAGKQILLAYWGNIAGFGQEAKD